KHLDFSKKDIYTLPLCNSRKTECCNLSLRNQRDFTTDVDNTSTMSLRLVHINQYWCTVYRCSIEEKGEEEGVIEEEEEEVGGRGRGYYEKRLGQRWCLVVVCKARKEVLKAKRPKRENFMIKGIRNLKFACEWIRQVDHSPN
ncbi:hypothetical protein BHM03_00042761, partial [Ensete ventricosum]